MLLFLRNLLQLLLSPTKGWEDVSAESSDTSVLMRRFLFPLMGFTALTVVLQRLYVDSLGIVLVVERALVVFGSLFVTFFFASTMFRSFFYRFCDGDPNDVKCSRVVVYMLGLVSLSLVVCNALPDDVGLGFLFPMCLALVLWKADVYLCVAPGKGFYFALFGFAVCIFPAYGLIYFFNLLIH